MAQRAPHDPVLAAFDRADRLPIVPLTDEETRLLAEAEADPGPPIPHAEFMRTVGQLPRDDDGE